MDWIKISVDDLESALNFNQLELLKSERAKTKKDFAEEILNSCIAIIRANIAASGLNMLDIDHSKIPSELRDCALRMAVEKLQARIPSLELSNTQIRQGDWANDILEKISCGQIPVSRPFIGVRTANPKKGISAAKNSTKKINSKSLEGL